MAELLRDARTRLGQRIRAAQGARADVESMLPLARQGYQLAPINPTCSLAAQGVPPPCWPAPKEFTAATVDPRDVHWQLNSENLLRRDFRTTPGKTAYHVPCHLKAWEVDFDRAT